MSSRWTVLAVLCLAVLLVAIDATVLNLAIPEITRELDPSVTQLLWILDIYSLVLAGLLVSAGTLSDWLGRRRVLLAGCTLFAVTSAAAAFAPSAELLIAARALMGVGGATIMPSTLALIRHVFTGPRERTLAIGIWSAMAAAGAAAGPILGGVLLEHFWWGSVFLINVPILAGLLVVGARTLPEARDEAPGRWDWPSAVASMAGLVALVLAVKEFAHDARPARLLAEFAVAALTLGWFARRQGRLASPLIDLGLFRRPAFTGAVLGNLLSLFALAGLLLFVSQYLQLVLRHSPLQAGVRLLPLTLGALVGAPLTALLIRRVGRRATVTSGLLLGAAGMAAFGAVLESGDLALALAMTAVGAGVGIALTATSDAIVSAAPPERAGAASSISETAYELGTGLGIAVLGSLLAAIYSSGLPTGLPEAAQESLAGALETAPTAVGAATDAFVSALETTAGVSASLLAAAAAVTWTLLGRSSAGDLAADVGGARQADLAR